jgi:hypothetical protein
MASRSRSCSRGVKKSGACKRKPGPKRSRSRSRKVRRSRSRSRSGSRKVRRSRSRSRSRKGSKSRSRSRKGRKGSKSRSRSRKSRSRSRKGGKGGNIYCVKCRKRTATNDLSDTCVAGKGGHSRNAETGTCAVCGAKKMRFKKGNC